MARKKTKARSIYVTKEPDWKELKLVTDPEQRIKAFDSCDYFVRTEISNKKKVECAKKWIKEHSGWEKDEIKIILANPDWAFSSSGAFYIFYQIGYIPEKLESYLRKKKDEWIERGKKELEEKKQQEEIKPKKPKISIQQRMLEQITDLCGDWDDMLDTFIGEEQFDLKKFDPEKDLKVYRGGIIKPAHAKLIKEQYEPIYAEAQESLEGTCEQLNEAYSFMNKKMKKQYVEFFEKINNACDAIILTGKANRTTRKPRARSKDTIIKKLKFQVSDGSLGIASVSPTDVVYANELWVYNTKTRKVGVYHAKSKDPRALARPGAGLMVKGTTIQDFDEETSMQKTLRKPAEQINNWTGKAKTKFAKAFDEVKTTPTKLNGRINDSTILLRVF